MEILARQVQYKLDWDAGRVARTQIPQATLKTSEFQPFDGFNSDFFEDWFPRFDTWIILNQIPPDLWQSALVTRLADREALWVQSLGLEDQPNGYLQLVLRLDRQYAYPSPLALDLGLHKQKQAPDETTKEFITRVTAIVGRMNRENPVTPEMMDRRIISAVVQGMRSEYAREMNLIRRALLYKSLLKFWSGMGRAK